MQQSAKKLASSNNIIQYVNAEQSSTAMMESKFAPKGGDYKLTGNTNENNVDLQFQALSSRRQMPSENNLFLGS